MADIDLRPEEKRQSYWATELPTLHPRMLLPARSAPSAFPFDNPGVRYVHFARNAIFALARHFGLQGAEVLVPAYFHGVEIEALQAAAVRPRFFAVRAGMRVDPEDVRQAVTPDTRAIYLIHYLGFPAPVNEIRRLCDERGLLLIEDCALALLSRMGDQWLGAVGDAAVFCLYKTLPTPDGGAVVLKEGSLALEGVTPPRLGTMRETAVALLNGLEMQSRGVARVVARSVRAAGRLLAQPAQSNWVHVGTQHFKAEDAKLLMSPVSRRVMEGQDVSAIVESRRRNYLHLESLLRDLAPPVFPTLPRGVCPLFYPFVTPRKRELWTALRRRGVQAVLFWMPGDVGPPAGAFPQVDVLRRTVLELPIHQDMTPKRIERLAATVRLALRALPA